MSDTALITSNLPGWLCQCWRNLVISYTRSRQTRSFHTIAHQTSCYTISPKHHPCWQNQIALQPTQTPSLSHTHIRTHAQTDEINGYFPLHQEVLYSRWPMEESAHSQDIQLHTCRNSSSLYLTHVRLRSTTFTDTALGKKCLRVHAHTCRLDIETRTQTLPLCHMETLQDLSHAEMLKRHRQIYE